MKQDVSRRLVFCGVLAPLWLIASVFVTAKFYPGYSHVEQALSELGATGAPTHTLTPILNHFPLALLFVLAGLGLFTTLRHSLAARWSAALVIAHGVFTLLAGLFPCELNCHPDALSTSQLLHNIAGGMLFLTLTSANAIWALTPALRAELRWFRVYSLVCLLAAFIALGFMAVAMTSGDSVGLYQRLNYGFSLLWLMSLCGVVSIAASSRDCEAR